MAAHWSDTVCVALLVLTSVSYVFANISARCLDCLSKSNPVPEDLECLEHRAKKLCGPFRISDGFYSDCRKLFTPRPGLDDFRNCTLDYDCAARCVEAQHNAVQDRCLAAIRMVDADYKELSCLDYGLMHALGPHGCGVDNSESEFWQRYQRNMTENCGCKVVYGSCTTATVPVTTTASITTEQLILYIVPAACALILIIVVVFCAVMLHGYAKRKRQRAELANRISQAEAKKKEMLATPNQQLQVSTANQRQSQYNPYTANPHNGSAQSLSAVEAQQDSEEYMSPSNDLPSLLVTTSDDSMSQLTLLMRKCEMEKGNEPNYVYDQAAPACPESADDNREEDGVTKSEKSPPPPDYINSMDVVSSFDPPYINGKYQPQLQEENNKQQSLPSKAPIPEPRDSNSTKSNTIPLYRTPSGLYVEEVNVGEDSHCKKGQYVIPELEEHYSNQQ